MVKKQFVQCDHSLGTAFWHCGQMPEKSNTVQKRIILAYTSECSFYGHFVQFLSGHMLFALLVQAGHGNKGKWRYKGDAKPLRHTPRNSLLPVRPQELIIMTCASNLNWNLISISSYCSSQNSDTRWDKCCTHEPRKAMSYSNHNKPWQPALIFHPVIATWV